jgi:hypothetical protein
MHQLVIVQDWIASEIASMTLNYWATLRNQCTQTYSMLHTFCQDKKFLQRGLDGNVEMFKEVFFVVLSESNGVVINSKRHRSNIFFWNGIDVISAVHKACKTHLSKADSMHSCDHRTQDSTTELRWKRCFSHSMRTAETTPFPFQEKSIGS